MTKAKAAETTELVVPEPTAEQREANPDTVPVPEEGAPPYPPEDAVLVETTAPIWEGGDPGTAVVSADDQDDAYYHPEPDTDGDGLPNNVDDDDDDDGILDVDEVP